MLNRLEPGIKHAPGVRCIVAVALTPSQSNDFLHVKALARQIFSIDLKHIEQADNGRIVKIIRQITPLWKCAGCGTTGVDILAGGVMWEVTADDGGGPMISAWATCYGNGAFQQNHLIPLGDDMTTLLI